MKRLIFRLLMALATLCAVAAVVVYIVLRSSLPELDGEITVTGVQAKATIERDAQGIPAITASSRNDLAFATGFAHAQDRYFQMDLTRRQAAGELAELFGEVAVPLDRRNRFHRFRSRAKSVIAAMTASERATMVAYVEGVNAGFNSLAAKPFEYFILAAEPRRWNLEDSVLTIYAMYMELNDERATRDVERGFVRLALPADVYHWMYPDGSEWDAPIVGEARKQIAIPGAASLDLRAKKLANPGVAMAEVGAPLLPGSNNWAVSGKLTSTGRAMVANDMHLRITVPGIFYRARLIVTGDDARDVTGVTLPGTPAVVSGSNGMVAWGFTNSYGDWSDAVLVRPADSPGTYITADGRREFTTYRERIEVKDGEPEELLIRETIWGPVLEDVSYPQGDVAVSWIAHAPVAVNIKQMQLEKVASVAEALSVAQQLGIPPQNFVTGDASGNIGWTIAGQMPRRHGAEALVPADWSTGEGWAGWLTPDEHPQVVNPDSGRIWTANSRVVDGDALRLLGDGGYDLGARARQIRDALFAQELFEPTDMLAIQMDDRAVFLARWRDLLLDVLNDEAVQGNDGRANYRDLVDSWTPRASADSVGYRLVRAFRIGVMAKVFRMLTIPVRDAFGAEVKIRPSNQFEGPLWQLVQEQPAHLLTSDYADWRALMLAAVDDNLSYVAENWTDGLEHRTWGERNMAAIEHPLSRALPWLSGWLDMPREPLNGDANMPKAQSPAFGASERYAVSPGDEDSAYMHIPAGQSGHPLSAFYRLGHDDWVHGRPSPFLPGKPEHRLVLTP
ncbi:MAG: penicillin acylase family protein [Gammaproteobacteria bacterium]|nr:penicillin acylase family protein [Gammaproteobacteria bacterium]